MRRRFVPLTSNVEGPLFVALTGWLGSPAVQAIIYNILSECTRFGVTPEAAGKEIDAITGVIRGWREHLHECGVPPHDIDRIVPHFRRPAFSTRNP